METCISSSILSQGTSLLRPKISPKSQCSVRYSFAILCFCSHPPPLVSLFWDLDNKPPKFSPYLAALHLRHLASQFGHVLDMVACANRHALLRTPSWFRKARQQNLSLDDLDRSWFVKPDRTHICSLCGWTGETKLGLKRHFKLLHERERQKRAYRLYSLRRRKDLRPRESFPSQGGRCKEANHINLGYNLDSELRRAGVSVRTVDHKPQAADRVLKRQIASSINKGVQCICLVSDDFDFSEILKKAQGERLLTVVIGDTDCLRRCADIWYAWDDVAQGLLQGIVGNEATAPHLPTLGDHDGIPTNFIAEYADTASVMDSLSTFEVPGLSEEVKAVDGILENTMSIDDNHMGDWQYEGN